MGILDSLVGAIEKHPDVSNQQHSTLVNSAMQMFGNRAGVSGLLQNAESQGLGHIVQSWIGTGANQSVAPNEVERIIGSDRLSQLASRAGVPPSIASAALSRVLPALVDRLTPRGDLPEAA